MEDMRHAIKISKSNNVYTITITDTKSNNNTKSFHKISNHCSLEINVPEHINDNVESMNCKFVGMELINMEEVVKIDILGIDSYILRINKEYVGNLIELIINNAY